MRLIDAIGNVILLSALYMIVELLAIKYGYTGSFASQDARLIFDGLVIAGTLSGSERGK